MRSGRCAAYHQGTGAHIQVGVLSKHALVNAVFQVLAALGVIAGDGIRDLLNFHVGGVANNVTDLFAHAAAGAQLPPGKQEARARKQQGHAARKILEQPGPVTAALRKGFRQPIHGFRQVSHHGNGKNHAQNRQGNAPALTFILAAALILAGGLLRVIRLCAVRVLVDLDPLLGFVRGFFRSLHHALGIPAHLFRFLRVRIDGAGGVRLAGLPVALAPALRRRDFAHSQQMVDDHYCNANRPRRKAECDYDHPPGDLEHTIPFVVFLAGVLPGAAGLVIQRLLPRTVLVFVIGVRVIRVWHSFFLTYLGQHRTIPALRLKHRSGGCGTASALPKCSIRHPVLSALLA